MKQMGELGWVLETADVFAPLEPVKQPVVDKEQALRRQIAALPIEERCADVCRGCGLHMFPDLGDRFRWLIEGGTATCDGCKLEKRREAKSG